jgi:hypothetical protein
MRPLHRAALALALIAAGLPACAGSLGSSDDDGGGVPDAGTGCTAFISFEPAIPVAAPGAVVRANATVEGAPGVIDYAWSVASPSGPLATSPAQADNSAITFPATAPGVYVVTLDVGAAIACPTVQTPLNVLAPGANQAQLRLRVTPPASANVPPFEKIVAVLGGADFSLGTVALDPGVTATATVQSGGTGVAAYVRLMPVAAKDAAVEAFTNSTGGFSARVLGQPHDVIVIPTVAGYAPRRARDWVPSTPTIAVGAGATVTGVVRGPGGLPLAGARVQLKIGDVPSTLATTTATGAFTVLAEPDPGEVIAVDVMPPAGSGLPRLSARSATAFDLAQPFQIDYAQLALRDLAGATIRRQGAPVPGAKVVVVGTLAAAGTVTAGATQVAAPGVVRIAATANGSGVLPAALAPAQPLSAVVEVAAGDHAVTAIDLTSATPAAIDAPPAVSIATQLRSPDGTPIADAVLDALPVGPLALAGATSVARARSGANGQLSASLAAGAHYDLRVHDPVRARGAPLSARAVSSQAVAASYTLRPALTATGKLLLQGSPTPVGGAAVELLCSTCSGLERSLPIAEGTSQPDGTFTLVVPDPGTN